MEIRLNKFLSRAGVASRREADRMIVEGRIKVNSRVVEELGFKIDDEKDKVEVDGKKIRKAEHFVYLMLNKPEGCLVTLKDPFRRPTIIRFLPKLKERIFPVGRLDYDSSGLLLLTNDGEFTNRLTHPRYKVKKVYLVKVKGEPAPSGLLKLEKGIFLDGKKTAPAKVKLIVRAPRRSLVRVEIFEGRKREVRRMFEAIGFRVVGLERISVGGLCLGKLRKGAWRFLTRQEVCLLRKQVNLEEKNKFA